MGVSQPVVIPEPLIEAAAWTRELVLVKSGAAWSTMKHQGCNVRIRKLGWADLLRTCESDQDGRSFQWPGQTQSPERSPGCETCPLCSPRTGRTWPPEGRGQSPGDRGYWPGALEAVDASSIHTRF